MEINHSHSRSSPARLYIKAQKIKYYSLQSKQEQAHIQHNELAHVVQKHRLVKMQNIRLLWCHFCQIQYWKVFAISEMCWAFPVFSVAIGRTRALTSLSGTQHLAEWSSWQGRIPEGKKKHVIIWLKGAIKTWSNLLRPLLSLPNSQCEE